MSSSKKKISAVSVVEIILIIILILVMIVMLASNFMFKKENSVASILGYSFYNTKAVNMQTQIPPNTLVIAKASEKETIIEGSVILCNIGSTTVLTRVKEIHNEENGLYYVVKFDTSLENETFRVEDDAVIAKAVWQFNGLGSFLDFATSTVGIIIAVVIPLIFIIAIQVARILSIRKLEDEAASLDDIDDFIRTRDEEEPAAVSFTEPKFLEDVTGKLPKVGGRESEPKIEKILSFDSRGRAEYTERPAEEKKDSPLYTYDKMAGKTEAARREPVYSGAKQESSGGDMYLNRPTKIEPEKSKVNEFFEKYGHSDKKEPVVFTPHMSNIIPDSIAAVQDETAAVRKSGFDDSVKAYYEKNTQQAQETRIAPEAFEHTEEKPAIPERATLPKETLAPPKKQKNNKALAELMSIIDAEENKLKK